MCVPVLACGGERLTLDFRYHPQSIPTLCFQSESLAEARTHQCCDAGWTEILRHPPVL